MGWPRGSCGRAGDPGAGLDGGSTLGAVRESRCGALRRSDDFWRRRPGVAGPLRAAGSAGGGGAASSGALAGGGGAAARRARLGWRRRPHWIRVGGRRGCVRLGRRQDARGDRPWTTAADDQFGAPRRSASVSLVSSGPGSPPALQVPGPGQGSGQVRGRRPRIVVPDPRPAPASEGRGGYCPAAGAGSGGSAARLWSSRRDRKRSRIELAQSRRSSGSLTGSSSVIRRAESKHLVKLTFRVPPQDPPAGAMTPRRHNAPGPTFLRVVDVGHPGSLPGASRTQARGVPAPVSRGTPALVPPPGDR